MAGTLGDDSVNRAILSAELLRDVLDKEPIGVALLSFPDYVYEFVNPAYQAFAPDRPMIGRRNEEIFPELAPMIPSLEAVVSASGGPWRREDEAFYMRRRLSGPMETVYATFEVSHVEVEGVRHLLVTAVDTTERVRLLGQTAQALRAEQRLRDTSDRINEIQRLLTSAMDFDEVLRRVAMSASEAVHADAAAVGFIEGDALQFRSVYNLPEAMTRSSLDLQRAEFARIAISTGRPVAVEDAFNDSRVDPRFARRFAIRAILAAPFSVKGAAAGNIAFCRLHQPVPFSQEEIDTAGKIAGAIGLAIENARLFDAERRELEFAEILDDVNRVIHSSLDYDQIMQRALEEGTKTLGARAGAVFIGLDGESEARYVYGFPRALLGRRFAADLFPFSRLMEDTKDPVPVGPAQMRQLMNPSLARLFRVRSLMAIPLLSRGRLVGGIGLVYGQPHEFPPLEVGFARRFGASVSLALENAELYRRQERVADTLQEALLTLPDRVPGLEFAHVYHSATETAKVGGDFYDLFELEDGAIGLTVGDIAGKGLDAAVLTALVKNAVRAQAIERGKTPKDVLRVVNQVLLKGSRAEMFATVFFGVLDLHDGRLTYCNAGHTTAAILHRDGRLEALKPNSPIVGAFSDVAFHDSEMRIEVDELLFMYTDGVVEARSGAVLFGEERLFQLLRELPGRDPAEAVGAVMDGVVAYTGGRLSDDIAILAARRT